MNSILVTKPIATLDGVVSVPSPVIFSHVSKSCIDTTLSGNSVRSGWEKFAQAGSLVTLFCETKSCTETSSTSSNNDTVVSMINYSVFASNMSLIIFIQTNAYWLELLEIRQFEESPWK